MTDGRLIIPVNSMDDELIPTWLEQPPSGKVNPPVETRSQELPFGDLAWEDFEKLCIRLASKDADIERCRLYGERGQKQDGIDIYARERDDKGKYRVYQCRRIEKLSSAGIQRAVSDFMQGQWADKSSSFIYCTSHSLRDTKLTDEIEAQTRVLAAIGTRFDAWDSETLSAKLKEDPKLVDDFFGRSWAEAYCGADARNELEKRLTPTELCKQALAHLDRQIAKEKNSKKYIPDVFTEVAEVKDKARYFAHPVLFLNKVLEQAARINIEPANRMFRVLSLEPVSPLPDELMVPVDKITDVEKRCEDLLQALRPVRDRLAPFASGHAKAIPTEVPSERYVLYEQICYYAQGASGGVMRAIDDLVDHLGLISSRVLCLVGRAGRGKTNFVCDFADGFLKSHSILCMLFTGRGINEADVRLIGEYMMKSVVGDRQGLGLDRFLEQLSSLCSECNNPAVVIVDGLNEHTSIRAFSQHLETLLEKLVQYPFIKVIITCRSEYFTQRFSNLTNASFASKLYLIQNLEGSMEDAHKEHLVYAYFRFFNLAARLHAKAWEALEQDALLLRMFCEAYGDHTASSVTELPEVLDIYREEIFRVYFNRVMARFAETQSHGSSLNVGLSTQIKRVFLKIIDMMLERGQFSNIPIADLDEELLPALETLLGEDVIVRKDLLENTSLLDEKSEVISFTFDEFRDFLIADQVINGAGSSDLAQFGRTLERLTDTECPVAEGLRKYSFFISKRIDRPSVQKVIREFDWYEEVFLECLFSLPDYLIAGEDIELLKDLFSRGLKYSAPIILGLLVRHNTDKYPKLSANVLFSLLLPLSERDYAKLVRPVFSRAEYEHFGIPYVSIGRLCNAIRKRHDDGGLAESDSTENTLQLLACLAPIEDQEYRAPAVILFREMADKHRELALSVLDACISQGGFIGLAASGLKADLAGEEMEE